MRSIRWKYHQDNTDLTKLLPGENYVFDGLTKCSKVKKYVLEKNVVIYAGNEYAFAPFIKYKLGIIVRLRPDSWIMIIKDGEIFLHYNDCKFAYQKGEFHAKRLYSMGESYVKIRELFNSLNLNIKIQMNVIFNKNYDQYVKEARSIINDLNKNYNGVFNTIYADNLTDIKISNFDKILSNKINKTVTPNNVRVQKQAPKKFKDYLKEYTSPGDKIRYRGKYFLVLGDYSVKFGRKTFNSLAKINRELFDLQGHTRVPITNLVEVKAKSGYTMINQI